MSDQTIELWILPSYRFWACLAVLAHRIPFPGHHWLYRRLAVCGMRWRVDGRGPWLRFKAAEG